MEPRQRWVFRVLTALSVAALIVWVLTAAARCGYPFELEWMEGGSLDHVERVLEGRDLYVEPGLEYGAYPYTPLYFWVAAGFAQVFGPGFLALRLVSILSTLAIFGLLFDCGRRLAREQGATRSLGLLSGVTSAALFAAAHRFAGAWLDLARVDALSIALLLACFHQMRFAPVRRATWLGALFGLAAFATKHSTLLPALALAPAAFYPAVLRDRRNGLALRSIVGGGCGSLGSIAGVAF